MQGLREDNRKPNHHYKRLRRIVKCEYTRCDNLITEIVAACHWDIQSGKLVYSSTFGHVRSQDDSSL